MQNCHHETVAGLILIRNRSCFGSARHAIADDTDALWLECIIVFSFCGMTANPVRRSTRLSIERPPVRIELLRRRTSLQLLLGSSRRGNGLVERIICGGLVRSTLVVVVCTGDARYRHQWQQERNREKAFR